MDSTLLNSTQSKSWLRYVPALFMLLFLAGGLFMSLWSPNVFKSPENKRFLNGEWAAAYEKTFNESLAIRGPSISTWGVLEYTLFNHGRDGVLIGKDGWLFTSEEFVFHLEGQEAIKEKLELAGEAKKLLAEQNINFVVVLVPSKARIYGDTLGRYRFPSYNEALYDAFARDLEALDIQMVRLLEPFNRGKEQQGVFLKTDTHWTPYGANVAATEIAEVVNKNNLLPSFGSTTFVTTPARSIRHQGDLLNYLPLGLLQERLSPAFDEFTEQTTTGENPDGGLFGSSTIPVTLVGTSYSANPLWNFAGFLKEALGADVLNVADEGSGPVEPMREYLKSQAFKDTPPELVVWEIPERFLEVAYP